VNAGAAAFSAQQCGSAPTKTADFDAQTEAVAEPRDAPVMPPSYSAIEKP
jgi:hypothetical protein